MIVGLDSRERAVLTAAAALAAELEAELVGLFVEDPDLLRFAALPFAREVGFASATRREMDRAAMERSLLALAEELRHACAAATQDAAVPWSFRSARGALARELLAAAAQGVPALLLPPVVRANPIVLCPPGVDTQELVAVREALERAFGEACDLFRELPEEDLVAGLLQAGHPVLVLAGTE